MPSATSSKPSPDSGAVRVTAPTLAEALRQARAVHGDDACIVESRAVLVKQEDGLGQRRLVEVVVAPPGTRAGLAPRPRKRTAPAGGDVATALAGEVDRIERLVASLTGGSRPAGGPADYPLAAVLTRAGASRATVERLAASFRGLPSADKGDMGAAVAHLRRQLRTSASDWSAFGGCHLFLGGAGAGKTDLVLGTAARLRAAKIKTLVLSLLPRHGGEIRRLQLEASRHGYDAAVMHRPEQLVTNAERLGGYAAVLIDTPSLFARSLREAGDLQSFICGHGAFHRHLVVPADADLLEQGDLWEAARLWNCDWTAVSRLDRCMRPGKLLDLTARVPYPFSLVAAGPWPGSQPELARADGLLRRLLGAGGAAQAAAVAA